MPKDLLKVNIGLMLNDNQVLITPTGINFTQDFKEKLYDKSEEFRAKILLDITAIVGDEWHVHFAEYVEGKIFDAYIYAPTIEDARIIVTIIRGKVINLDFKFEYKGDISSLMIKNNLS